jgi:hypothetical protein
VQSQAVAATLLLMFVTCFSGVPFIHPFGARAVAAEPPPGKEDKKIEELIGTMTDAKATWEARCKAEDELAKLPPGKVLPKLLKLAAQPMPSGGIYNSGGREHDKDAPVKWQLFYAVGRSWAAQMENLNSEKGGEVVLRLLGSAASKSEKALVARELDSHWDGKVEEPLAKMLRDANSPADLQLAAASALTRHGQQKYQDDILAAAARAKDEDKVRLLEVLASRPNKERNGIDPRVLTLGFTLIQKAEDQYQKAVAKTPDAFHGGYFMTCWLGTYVGEKFAPNPDDPRYKNTASRDPKWFADTVANGLKWWEKNQNRFKVPKP